MMYSQDSSHSIFSFLLHIIKDTLLRGWLGKYFLRSMIWFSHKSKQFYMEQGLLICNTTDTLAFARGAGDDLNKNCVEEIESGNIGHYNFFCPSSYDLIYQNFILFGRNRDKGDWAIVLWDISLLLSGFRKRTPCQVDLLNLYNCMEMLCIIFYLSKRKNKVKCLVFGLGFGYRVLECVYVSDLLTKTRICCHR